MLPPVTGAVPGADAAAPADFGQINLVADGDSGLQALLGGHHRLDDLLGRGLALDAGDASARPEAAASVQRAMLPPVTGAVPGADAAAPADLLSSR
jgi:hypothetical protein